MGVLLSGSSSSAFRQCLHHSADAGQLLESRNSPLNMMLRKVTDMLVTTLKFIRESVSRSVALASVPKHPLIAPSEQKAGLNETYLTNKSA